MNIKIILLINRLIILITAKILFKNMPIMEFFMFYNGKIYYIY